jgi:hypothetical protein
MDSTFPLLAVFAPTLYILGAVASLVQFQVVLMLIQQVSRIIADHSQGSSKYISLPTVVSFARSGLLRRLQWYEMRWGLDAMHAGCCEVETH